MATAVSTDRRRRRARDAVPQIVQLDPALLVRDTCTTRTTDPDEKLVTSVKELGVEGHQRSRCPAAPTASSRADGAPRQPKQPMPRRAGRPSRARGQRVRARGSGRRRRLDPAPVPGRERPPRA
ncbi:hypothetical protein LV779_22015 [Streptomyces thinghirensis]|nr:hypothetical protein [Streptomyces thinghirensis]